MTMSDLSCLICDVSLDVSSCVNIFYASLPRSGELLVNFVVRVLRVSSTDFRGSYICTQCYNLFEMLEQAQRTVVNIRCEILKVYRTSERRKNVKLGLCNAASLNLSTNVAFEEPCVPNTKLGANTKKDLSKVTLGLSQAEIQEPKQIYTLSTDQNVHIDPIEEAKKNIKKQISNSKELDKPKSYDCSNSSVVIKDDLIVKSDGFHNSVLSNNDNNVQLVNVLHEKEVCCTERCKTCNRLFKSTKEYNTHLLKHNISQPYECQMCQEKFSDISLANTHALNKHIAEKGCIVVVSDSCKNELENCVRSDADFAGNKMQTENIVHTINFAWKEIQENIIDVKENSKSTAETKIDPGKASAKLGKTLKHSVKPLKYSCPTCGKKWKTSAELNSHVKTHSTLRPYMCEKCGQAYKHKHALEVHVGMHNGINPFQCSFCNKCFTQKGALMRHLPMHTGETPYQCELCGKRFVHHTSYNMHRLSHTGKKAYKCHICDLSLLSTSHLKRHMRVHTGEKPYSCTLCGKRFAERYNLFAHQKIHDPSEIKTKKSAELQHKCNECNLTFEKKESFYEHTKQHASVENESKKAHDDFEIENDKLSNKVVEENNTLSQTWVQINRTKLDAVEDQAKFVLLEHPLPQINNSSFAVTFNNPKMLGDANYNTSLQVMIGPSNAPVLSNNHLTIDKTHM